LFAHPQLSAQGQITDSAPSPTIEGLSPTMPVNPADDEKLCSSNRPTARMLAFMVLDALRVEDRTWSQQPGCEAMRTVCTDGDAVLKVNCLATRNLGRYRERDELLMTREYDRGLLRVQETLQEGQRFDYLFVAVTQHWPVVFRAWRVPADQILQMLADSDVGNETGRAVYTRLRVWEYRDGMVYLSGAARVAIGEHELKLKLSEKDERLIAASARAEGWADPVPAPSAKRISRIAQSAVRDTVMIDRLVNGEIDRPTRSDLLGWFGFKRATRGQVEQIRRELARQGLVAQDQSWWGVIDSTASAAPWHLRARVKPKDDPMTWWWGEGSGMVRLLEESLADGESWLSLDTLVASVGDSPQFLRSRLPDLLQYMGFRIEGWDGFWQRFAVDSAAEDALSRHERHPTMAELCLRLLPVEGKASGIASSPQGRVGDLVHVDRAPLTVDASLGVGDAIEAMLQVNCAVAVVTKGTECVCGVLERKAVGRALAKEACRPELLPYMTDASQIYACEAGHRLSARLQGNRYGVVVDAKKQLCGLIDSRNVPPGSASSRNV